MSTRKNYSANEKMKSKWKNDKLLFDQWNRFYADISVTASDIDIGSSGECLGMKIGNFSVFHLRS